MNQYTKPQEPQYAELIKVQPSVPLVSKHLFADLVGVTARTVDGWIEKGHIPTVKVGRHPLVNLALMYQQCLIQEIAK